MKNWIRLLALLLVLVTAFGVVACEPKKKDDPDVDPNNPGEEEEEVIPTVEELLLVEDKKATFSVVYTSASGLKAKELADDLARLLVQVDAAEGGAVADTAADSVADVEVIIGCNPKNRTKKLVIADRASLGENDWKVELVGKRVLIYGGCDDALQKAYDYFVGSVLKLKATSTSISKTVRIKSADFGKTYRQIESITVNGEDLNGFTIVYNELASDWYDQKTAAEALAKGFADYAGITLNVETASNHKATERIVKIVNTDEAGETGFRIRVDGKRLLLEYRYTTTVVRSVNDFIANKVAAFKGKVEMTAHTEYTEHGDYLYYEDYGAVGNGKANDFLALYNTHVEANKTGQTVRANDNATYYIGTQDGLEVPIKTNVVWGTAKFIIDDTIVTKAMKERNLDVFHVAPTYTQKKYTKEQLKTLNGGQDVALHPGDATFVIADKSIFEGAECLIIPYYTGKKIFIRWGNNENSGADTHEVLRVDKDGNIGDNTYVEFDYPTVDLLTVLRVDETPITIDGGIFTTWANNAERTYDYYHRGILINRSNTTFVNIEHYIEREYADGAPYSGFLLFDSVNRVLVKDCKVSGHKAYPLKTDASNIMGSYDMSGSVANDITWDNVTQLNSIVNQDYWGVHGSNFCKNFTMKNCYLSRIDAHSGMFNATIIDTTLGQFCNCIGGGKLYMENVRRVAGNDFITLRIDYGSTWHGEMIFKNCSLDGCTRDYGCIDDENQTISDFILIHGYYRNHNFGFDCYMTTGITIDGFKCGKDGKGSLTLLQIDTAVWPADKRAGHPYIMPKTITIKGLESSDYRLTNDTGNLCSVSTTTVIDLDKKST